MDIKDRLHNILKERKKIAVAYSGGTDSDFLLNFAVDVLGKENVYAIIANGIMLADKDLKDAVRLAEKSGAKYTVVDVDALKVEEFRNNTEERCYFCKKNIMGAVIAKAKEEGFEFVADGKNKDDGLKFRPGAKAAEELGIISPLYEAGFTKNDIRQRGKEMGIETWDKKSNSCLATRFAYNTLLTEEKLKMVERAEKYIADKGYRGARVRVHGDLARIEVEPCDIEKFVLEKETIKNIKNTGFKYVTLDLEGFRSGSMD